MPPEILPLAFGEPALEPVCIRLSAGAVLLRGFARIQAPDLLAALNAVRRISPLRHMQTPGGWRMSVAMTNCGKAGWVTDASGYRYDAIDPDSGRPWPAMPEVFGTLAREAAEAAGFADFRPDACLINQYAPGARLSLHQDRNEHDFGAPIVSVSLGLPASFLRGGEKRADKTARIPLIHGDVAVWGGADRLRFHGVLALKDGTHPLTGAFRYNLTFRKAR
jgi:DNA oxidative demethylase